MLLCYFQIQCTFKNIYFVTKIPVMAPKTPELTFQCTRMQLSVPEQQKERFLLPLTARAVLINRRSLKSARRIFSG